MNNNQYVDFAQNQIFKYLVCHSEMICFENYIINTSSVECLIVLPQSIDIPNHEKYATVKHNTSIKKYIE